LSDSFVYAYLDAAKELKDITERLREPLKDYARAANSLWALQYGTAGSCFPISLVPLEDVRAMLREWVRRRDALLSAWNNVPVALRSGMRDPDRLVKEIYL
jgi:hypothetical protein